MNRKQLEEILVLIFKTKKADDEKQEAFGKLFEIISPSTFLPYIEIDKTEEMLGIIKILNPELSEEISYFLWEAPSFYDREEGCAITEGEKTTVIRNNKEAILYILDNYSTEYESKN